MSDPRVAATIASYIVAMALVGVLALRHRTGSVVLVLMSFAWLTFDDRWEGPVLWSLSPDHGLVQADLVSVVGLAMAWLAEVVRGVRWLVGLRHRRRRSAAHRIGTAGLVRHAHTSLLDDDPLAPLLAHAAPEPQVAPSTSVLLRQPPPEPTPSAHAPHHTPSHLPHQRSRPVRPRDAARRAR